MSELHLSGPTVTVFGDRDELGQALGEELRLRGWSTHEVTTPMGWFSSATHAVIRLDAPAGLRAIEELASGDAPGAHVVAVRQAVEGEQAEDSLDELCRQCSTLHDVSVIRHPPCELATGAGVEAAPDDLAIAIADEIVRQSARDAVPSFASRAIGALHDGGHT